MSESLSAHAGLPFDTPLPASKAGACGLPIDDVEWRVVDPDTRQPVPSGEIGELEIRGPALMTRFYKIDPAATFTADGFYPTSDLVRVDEDGYLFFVARLGDMIKSSGANVSALEVEAALNAQPGVQLSVVVGLGEDVLSQHIAAAVVPEPGAQLGEVDLQRVLRDRLASYKVPKHIVFISAADLKWTMQGETTASKLKRQEMKSLIAARMQART